DVNLAALCKSVKCLLNTSCRLAVSCDGCPPLVTCIQNHLLEEGHSSILPLK
ncbi:hypothetical protein BgiBS90_034261, partial [Biomphalaria glabrata]